MITFKGFDRDMTCRYGQGKFQYEVGKTAYAELSKTGRTGLHSSENVLLCLSYYPPKSGGRICLCEAGGDIDEDAGREVSSTELTPVRELSKKEIVAEAVMFIMKHPEAASSGNYVVSDSGEAEEDEILIVRGNRPMARGKKNAVIGLCRDVDGKVEARMFAVGRQYREDTWYGLTENGIEEVTA